jgi:hypothetical protein
MSYLAFDQVSSSRAGGPVTILGVLAMTKSRIALILSASALCMGLAAAPAASFAATQSAQGTKATTKKAAKKAPKKAAKKAAPAAKQ